MYFNKEETQQVKQALTEWINYLVGVQKEFRELDQSNKILIKLNNRFQKAFTSGELTVISHALDYRKEMLIKENTIERDLLKAIETTERLKKDYEKA